MKNLKKLYKAIHKFRIEVTDPNEYDSMKTAQVSDVFIELDIHLVNTQQKILDILEDMSSKNG